MGKGGQKILPPLFFFFHLFVGRGGVVSEEIQNFKLKDLLTKYYYFFPNLGENKKWQLIFQQRLFFDIVA